MALFRLSRLAEADLTDIGAYTLQTWGEDQAARYIDNLEGVVSVWQISQAGS